MHEQRLQIVPALGSPSAAPYLRPLLSRDTPGPGDTQQVKPGLLSCRRFLYTAPVRPPARPLRTRLLPFRSLGERGAKQLALEGGDRPRGSTDPASSVRPLPGSWPESTGARGVSDAIEQPAAVARAARPSSAAGSPRTARRLRFHPALRRGSQLRLFRGSGTARQTSPGSEQRLFPAPP